MPLLMSGLENFLAQWKPLSDVVIDSWFVCNNERTIVDFNRAFFSLLPKQVARNLKGKKCYEVLALNICADRCIAEQCWQEKRHVRLNEIEGQPPTADRPSRFILSAIPIYDDQGQPIGALEIQRDVTDEAMVQVKYQEMLDHEAKERERLSAQIRGRTKELIEANRRLLQLQGELLDYKKGIAV